MCSTYYHSTCRLISQSPPLPPPKMKTAAIFFLRPSQYGSANIPSLFLNEPRWLEMNDLFSCKYTARRRRESASVYSFKERKKERIGFFGGRRESVRGTFRRPSEKKKRSRQRVLLPIHLRLVVHSLSLLRRRWASRLFRFSLREPMEGEKSVPHQTRHITEALVLRRDEKKNSFRV